MSRTISPQITIALLTRVYAPTSGEYFATLRAAGYSDEAIAKECYDYAGTASVDGERFVTMLQRRIGEVQEEVAARL